MPSRLAPRIAAQAAVAVVALAVAGCGGSAASAPSGPSGPSSPAVAHPTLVPIVSPTVAPTPRPTPDVGNVDKGRYPELSIEPVGPDTIRLTLADPAAKAWRIVVAGTGALAYDRFEIVVETGDVAPTITGTEIRGDDVVDVIDLSAFASGQGAAGGCHATLHVCIDSGGFDLPADGNGTFSMRLSVPDRGVPLTITGATAGWPGEPFILGSWTDTEAFPWNAG